MRKESYTAKEWSTQHYDEVDQLCAGTALLLGTVDLVCFFSFDGVQLSLQV